MTDERRRSTDPMLAELFRQNERQHVASQEARLEDTRKLDAINGKLAELLRTDDRHGFRLDAIESWQKDIVNPFLESAREGIAQAKGAGKAVKATYTIVGIVGGGVIYKVGVALMAALPK
jgi:hypothetical protein